MRILILLILILSNSFSVLSENQFFNIKGQLPKYIVIDSREDTESYNSNDCTKPKFTIRIIEKKLKKKRDNSIYLDIERGMGKIIISKYYDSFEGVIPFEDRPIMEGQPENGYYKDSQLAFKLKNDFNSMVFNIEYKKSICSSYVFDKSYKFDELISVNFSSTLTKNDKSESNNLTSDNTDEKYNFLPFPFVDSDRLSDITLDSVVKNIMNTTKINDMSRKLGGDDKYEVVSGVGKLISNSPDFIYHINKGMTTHYDDDILTYFIEKTTNKSNYKLDKEDQMYSDGSVDKVSDLPTRYLRFVGNEYDYKRNINVIVSSNYTKGDTNYFPKNNRTNKQEVGINLIILEGKLSGITFQLCSNNYIESGEVINPLTQKTNSNLIKKFTSLLDKLYGKSKLYTNISERGTKIRVWKINNNILSIEYRWGDRIYEIEYTDDKYTSDYYHKLQTKLKTMNKYDHGIGYYFPRSYGQYKEGRFK